MTMQMPDKRCCDHRLYGCDYTQYMELFPHYCNVLPLQGSNEKAFIFLYALMISRVHRNYPSSITFSQLWQNSSQLARLFKMKVALSPELNTAR